MLKPIFSDILLWFSFEKFENWLQLKNPMRIHFSESTTNNNNNDNRNRNRNPTTIKADRMRGHFEFVSGSFEITNVNYSITSNIFRFESCLLLLSTLWCQYIYYIYSLYTMAKNTHTHTVCFVYRFNQHNLWCQFNN